MTSGLYLEENQLSLDLGIFLESLFQIAVQLRGKNPANGNHMQLTQLRCQYLEMF